MRRWVIGGVVALLLAFGIAAAVGRDSGFGDGRWDDGRVERVVDADGTETIVVHDGDRGFPFGIIVVPLVIFGLIALARGIFGRGPGGGPGRWGGPGGPGAWGYGPPWAWGGPTGPGSAAGPDPVAASGPPAPPHWFEEWHRRAHAGQPSPASLPPAPPASPSPAAEPPAAPPPAAPPATRPAAPPAPGVD